MKTENNAAVTFDCVGQLDAVLIHADGTHRDLGTISGAHNHRLIGRPIQWWRALWRALRAHHIIAAAMGFSAFLAAYAVVDQPRLMQALLTDQRVVDIIMGAGVAGLVVQNGANFLAADFTAGLASPRISSMNYHDSGSGATSATSTDSGLQTQAGPSTRATGVQSNPVTNVYKTIGTIAYTTTLGITEWGLFNQAAQGGTMWDRRVFSVINVVNLDSLSISYSLTILGGGT